MRSDRPTATDFVQDYAAKRAAQLERAKKIREERLQLRQQENKVSPSSSYTNNNTINNNNNNNMSTNDVSSDVTMPPSILPTAARSRRIANVVEEDFKRATRAGIITPDQARQLWAMLSDQLVQADNTGASTLSNSYNVNNPSGTLKESSIPTMTFGNSISLDSLRASIAQFKEQQKREQQGQDLTGRIRVKSQGIKASNNVNEAYELATRVFAPPPAGAIAGTAGAAMSRPVRRELCTGGNDYENWSKEIEEPTSSDVDNLGLRRGTPPLKGKREKQQSQKKKPPWNFDLGTVDKDEDDIAKEAPLKVPSSRKGRGAERNTQKRVDMPVQFDNTPIGVWPPQLETQFKQHQQLKEQPLQSFGNKAGGNKKNVTNTPRQPSSHPTVSPDDIVVGSGGGGYGLLGASAPSPPPPSSNEPLLPCNICGRTFRASILSRHTDACRKLQKKRRTFDTKMQRLEGIEGIHEVIAHNVPFRNDRKQPAVNTGSNPNKMPKWKIQHEQFQAAMRAIKQMDAGNVEGIGSGGRKSNQLPPPPAPMPEAYDDRVPCPHCGRKFAELTAQRHIPKCMTTIAKPKGIRPTRR